MNRSNFTEEDLAPETQVTLPTTIALLDTQGRRMAMTSRLGAFTSMLLLLAEEGKLSKIYRDMMRKEFRLGVFSSDTDDLRILEAAERRAVATPKRS